MIAEAVALLAEWLADGTTGVNALLASVPKDVGWATPPAVTIKSEISDSWVTREVIDENLITGPMLILNGIVPEQGGLAAIHPAKARTPKPEAVVLVRFAVRTTDTKAGALQARLTLRAAKRSIAVQFPSLQTTATRNQVTLDPPELRDFPLVESVEHRLVIGGFLVTFPADDPWSYGITQA
jgi:hypothetical protein